MGALGWVLRTVAQRRVSPLLPAGRTLRPAALVGQDARFLRRSGSRPRPTTILTASRRRQTVEIGQTRAPPRFTGTEA